MFKFLASKNDDPGFDNAVILTNRSEHWLELDDAGRRLPPHSHAAMDSEIVANSDRISAHIHAGLLSTSGTTVSSNNPKPKRKKKEAEAKVEAPQEDVVVNEPIVETLPEQNDSVSPIDSLATLVADTTPQNWVSSTEDIVGEPTPDQI